MNNPRFFLLRPNRIEQDDVDGADAGADEEEPVGERNLERFRAGILAGNFQNANLAMRHGAAIVPTRLDVLFQRGKRRHPGNQHLHRLIEPLKQSYLEANGDEKRNITLRIVYQIQDEGGRFLRKEGARPWYPLSDVAAQKKVAHILREYRSSPEIIAQRQVSADRERAVAEAARQDELSWREGHKQEVFGNHHSRENSDGSNYFVSRGIAPGLSQSAVANPGALAQYQMMMPPFDPNNETQEEYNNRYAMFGRWAYQALPQQQQLLQPSLADTIGTPKSPPPSRSGQDPPGKPPSD